MLTEILSSSGNAVVNVSGRIDTSTAPAFQNDMNALDYDAIERLTLDFNDVLYVSSAGLRVLLILKKRMGDRPFALINVNASVAEILETTGFSQLLDYRAVNSDTDYSHMSFKEFLAQKVRTGTAEAVLYSDGLSYTWSELDKCAQIMAADLHKQGVTKGSHVAISSPNSANWIITFYAIQKLGAIACLVNFNLGAQEVVTLSKVGDITHFCYGAMPQMKDEGEFLSAIKSDGSLITSVYNIRGSVNFKDRLGEYGNVEGRFEGKVEADDACVMIFTSGSTGTPKGVLLSAYNILNASSAMADIIRLSSQDKACLITPMFHILGLTTGLFANGIADAPMFIPESLKTAELIRVISTEGITAFHSVPTMMLAIVNNPGFSVEKVSSLRATILAGSPVSEAQMVMLREKFPANNFYIAYGLSEMAPVTMTVYGDTEEHITQTIGKPVGGVEIKIWDTDNNCECKPGDTGEIIVQGYNLMSCYYKAELDKQAVDAEGWLHTGDLGHFDAEGYIHFSGRAKELIIRGGENIVPNEIASAISEDEAVADVKVVGVPDNFWGETVAAAVLMKDGHTFDEQAMRAALAGKLAKYKIPAYFIVYDKFPFLPNGKVDAVNLKKDVIEKVSRLTGK